MIIEVVPCFFSSRSKSSSCFASVSFKEAVGSSRMRRRTFFPKAFAISTSCCFPTPISFIKVSGDSFKFTNFKSSAAFLFVSSQSILAACPRSLPRNIFSAMESSGTSASS